VVERWVMLLRPTESLSTGDPGVELGGFLLPESQRTSCDYGADATTRIQSATPGVRQRQARS
jgi:hypothetical protein